MKEEWWRMMKDEGWMMKDDDFNLLRGFGNGRTLVNVELLLQLKMMENGANHVIYMTVNSWHTLLWCMIFVLIILTSKYFWLLQCLWHKTRVTFSWCITTCSHWNHYIWSQDLWELDLNHRSTEYQTIFWNQNFVFSELLWPYKMVSVTAIGNTS